MTALALLLLAAAPAGLPERVDLETGLVSHTAKHDLAIAEGRVWWKPRGASAEQWVKIPPDGLPTSKTKPAALTGLSADGDNLVVFSSEGRVFYTKLSTLEWTDVWGPAGMRGALSVAFPHRALAMSHRLTYYEDIDGNPHPITAGVTTFYALDEDGRWITYADPWLPPKFERRLCLPLHGALVAQTLSASASTLFISDAHGNLFTRLADFDTVGDDPLLPYSYGREKRKGADDAIRTLPLEEWVQQPPIPGKHTTRLTIRQTGQGNAARELKVEGEGGYWKKMLLETKWERVATGQPAGAPFVEPGPPVTAPSASRALSGTLTGPIKAAVTTQDFDPDCSPAHLALDSGGVRFTAELHFHGGLRTGAHGRRFQGALIDPRPKDAKPAAALFGGRAFIDVEVKLDEKGQLSALEIPSGPGPGTPLKLELK